MLIFSSNYGTILMQRPFIAGMLKQTIVKCMLPKPETLYSTCRFSEGQRRRGRKELLLNRNSKAVLIQLSCGWPPQTSLSANGLRITITHVLPVDHGLAIVTGAY